jgi:hypothetical protein
MRVLVVALVAVSTFAVALSPANAARVDCSFTANSCGFASAFEPNIASGVGSGPVLGIAVDGFAFVTGSTYSYAYRVTNSNTGAQVLTALLIQAEQFTGKWGLITDQTTEFVTASFTEGASGFGVSTSLAGNNRVLSFYFQSLVGPGEGGYSATVSGTTGEGSTLSAVPEPGTLMLVGIGGLLAAPWLRNRRRA